MSAEKSLNRRSWNLVVNNERFSAGSVIYWRWSELHGAGDLRLYILAQFYPMLAMPLILLLFSAKYTRSMELWVVFGLYAAARLFELLDGKIFSLDQIVSGHTLKHLAAALAVYWILRMLQYRQPLAARSESTPEN